MSNQETIKKFLHANPEVGAAFYDHWEKRREELISVPWTSHNPELNTKCQVVAAFINEELLNDFGLKEVSRKRK